MLPEELSLERRFTRTHGKNLIASRNVKGDTLRFLRIPPATSQKSIERWDIPPFPFNIEAFSAYPPDDILAVAEVQGR